MFFCVALQVQVTEWSAGSLDLPLVDRWRKKRIKILPTGSGYSLDPEYPPKAGILNSQSPAVPCLEAVDPLRIPQARVHGINLKL